MRAHHQMSRRIVLATILSLATFAGCGSTAAIEGQERSDFDREVETKWKEHWDWVDGLQFLEKGGIYVDSDEPGAIPYDKPQVLPLLKRLSSKHGLRWTAIIDRRKRNIALAFVAKFPDVEGSRKAVSESLNAEQADFPLDILVQEGNRWLSLDFLSPEDSKFLSDTPTE